MSDAPTLVIEAGDLEGEARLRVEGDVFHHFFRARRLAVGERVRVADGAGSARFGLVATVDRRHAEIVLESTAPTREPRLRLTVASATLRPERASWLVEKCTEVGVDRFLWFNSCRAPRRLSGSALERLARVARAAVEQCGRSRLPRIATTSWDEIVAAVPEHRSVLLDPAAEGGTATPPRRAAEELTAAPEGSAPLLLLGPEGGFSSAERRQLRDAGALPLWLGPRTLRAETAALIGAALILGGGID